eukprot:2751357-Amphidinium_carterae.1
MNPLPFCNAVLEPLQGPRREVDVITKVLPNGTQEAGCKSCIVSTDAHCRPIVLERMLSFHEAATVVSLQYQQ